MAACVCFSAREEKRAESGDSEAEVAMATGVVESDKEKVHTDVLLFNRWSYDDVQVSPLLSFFLFLLSLLFAYCMCIHPLPLRLCICRDVTMFSIHP